MRGQRFEWIAIFCATFGLAACGASTRGGAQSSEPEAAQPETSELDPSHLMRWQEGLYAEYLLTEPSGGRRHL